MKMTWDYIAGFFDGEGHTRASESRFVAQLTQKDRKVLDEIALFLEEKGFHPAFQQNKSNGCWVLCLWRVAEVEKFLKKMQGRVIVKEQQTENVLAAISNRNRRGNFSKVKPTRARLRSLLRSMTTTEISRMFGVSQTAVAGWCQSYELDYKKRGGHVA